MYDHRDPGFDLQEFRYAAGLSRRPYGGLSVSGQGASTSIPLVEELVEAQTVHLAGDHGPVGMLWDFGKKLKGDKFLFDIWSDYVRKTSIAKQFWKYVDFGSMAATQQPPIPLKDAKAFVTGLKQIYKLAHDSIKKNGSIPKQKEILNWFKSEVVDTWDYEIKNPVTEGRGRRLHEDAAVKRVFDSLKVGDSVTIEAPGLKKARTLKVTSGPDHSGKRTYVSVASGYVRPGNRGGGMLTYTKDAVYGDKPDEVSFQPTLMQRPVVVSKLTRLMGEASGPKLDNATKRKINQDLVKAGLDGNGRFNKVGAGVAAAFGVLAKHGLEQDEVVGSDKFRSHNKDGTMGGNTMIRVAFSDPTDSFNTFPITTSALAVSWSDAGSRVEVVAYMS